MKNLFFFFLFSISLQFYGQISDFEHIDFKKADSIANVYKDEDLNNLTNLAYSLSENLDTDIERFRAIYKWVCENIANDYSLYHKNKRKRERFKDDSLKLQSWNVSFRKKLFKKLLKRQRTICTGYAYVLKELANAIDIECEIVQGFARVSTTDIENLTLPNHSWNAVKLNEKWYLCDPTWASGIPNPETNRFQFKYNDGFFMAEPSLLAINHFPVEEKWWQLNVTPPTFNSFLNGPILYGDAFEILERHISPEKMHQDISKNEMIEFQYQLRNLVEKDEISLLLYNGTTSWTTKPSSVSIDNRLLNLKQVFQHSGFYDVHLYIQNRLIATYTVKVGD
ncbi:transglutaminase domain-containing protein [Winogradskyella ursingii]|uniref:transglutaminase domain-containing protein n=1 Tax=Winogradskyella ursingii TaxID=2686079 RepID=UPI0015CC4987|nr:transglutaminase domain-containing protein [Winogradskyella ursingii]